MTWCCFWFTNWAMHSLHNVSWTWKICTCLYHFKFQLFQCNDVFIDTATMASQPTSLIFLRLICCTKAANCNNSQHKSADTFWLSCYDSWVGSFLIAVFGVFLLANLTLLCSLFFNWDVTQEAWIYWTSSFLKGSSFSISLHREIQLFLGQKMTSWWFQPIKKNMLIKLDLFPKQGVNILTTYLMPSPKWYISTWVLLFSTKRHPGRHFKHLTPASHRITFREKARSGFHPLRSWWEKSDVLFQWKWSTAIYTDRIHGNGIFTYMNSWFLS